MDWKIELVAIPVTDVDRAKTFYVEQVGFNTRFKGTLLRGPQSQLRGAP
jgi:extradiol dioxygenase family protein